MKEQIKKLRYNSRHYEQLLQQIAKRQHALKTEGNLQIIKEKGRLKFYQYFGSKSKTRYLKKSASKLLAALAQKKYDKQVYNVIKAKKHAVDGCIKVLDNKEALLDLRAIYEAFPKELKPLIRPVERLNDDYAKKWQARDYGRSKRSINTNLRTKRGEFVRSKSELIIANKLYDAGLPYHYEAVFTGEQFFANPDFFILNPRTGKEFLWEHFGLLSKPDYLEDTLYKIEEYAKCGFIQGDNFIATYESADHQLNTEYVDQLIGRLLLSG